MTAIIKSKIDIGLDLTFTINESEARALDGLAGYGDDAFIKVFYEKMGRHYMEAHEQGLRNFLKAIRGAIPNELRRVDEARMYLSKK